MPDWAFSRIFHRLHDYISFCFCREGSRVIWGYINRILGQPSLIRESSMSRFPGSEIISQAKNKVLNYSTSAAASGALGNQKGLGNIVLHPSLQKRIEHLARATANTKAHQAPFRNMLFYGPPGTGKTMVAREIARKSVWYHRMDSYTIFPAKLLKLTCRSFRNCQFLIILGAVFCRVWITL